MIRWMRRGLWPAIKASFVNWNHHEGGLMSAAMAYYASFSLLPLCLVLMAGVGLVTRYSAKAQDTRQELLKIISQNASPWVATQIDRTLIGVETNVSLGGPIGIAMLVLAAIGIFAQFENIFQRIWANGIPPSKGVLHAVRTALYDRLMAFVMLLIVGVLVIVIFLANIALTSLRPHIVQFAGGWAAWRFGQTLATILFNTLLFGVLYKIVPKAPVQWLDALGGGVFVAIVWEIGQRIFEHVVVATSYSAYGVVGSFMAVMLWTYYASAVIFLGGEFVQALCQDCHGREKVPERSAFDV